MDLDLLSLPPEILAKIFSYIPWNQLINIKLSAKKFKYVTEKYLNDMQKPKLYLIVFENESTHDDGIDRIRIIYGIIIIDEDGLEENISSEKEFFLLPSELDDLHGFLQKVDLTSLRHVGISLDNHTEVMAIFSGYFHNRSTINSICVTAKNSQEDLGNTLLFLQKIQNVVDLALQLHLPCLNVSKDFVIPVRNSLVSILIRERENTAFINSKMIKYIVENNPLLNIYFLSLNNFETYKMVIETIVKRELSRRKNNCFHRDISIGYDISRREALSQLLGYFYSEEFPYNNGIIQDECILYYGNLKCSVCGGFDSIEISKYRLY
uniref:F-box domain-containing protein n=1 Tax=Strongyloides venezuelensis TaxID=75913 RepID=A0A0K0EWE0_STRVS